MSKKLYNATQMLGAIIDIIADTMKGDSQITNYYTYLNIVYMSIV